MLGLHPDSLGICESQTVFHQDNNIFELANSDLKGIVSPSPDKRPPTPTDNAL